jgi:hypothetical protein
MLEEMEEELNDLEVDWLIDDYELFAGDKRRKTKKMGEDGCCFCDYGLLKLNEILQVRLEIEGGEKKKGLCL